MRPRNFLIVKLKAVWVWSAALALLGVLDIVVMVMVLASHDGRVRPVHPPVLPPRAEHR
jgi:hypothetical protein